MSETNEYLVFGIVDINPSRYHHTGNQNKGKLTVKPVGKVWALLNPPHIVEI
jgi:hypothetical protein